MTSTNGPHIFYVYEGNFIAWNGEAGQAGFSSLDPDIQKTFLRETRQEHDAGNFIAWIGEAGQAEFSSLDPEIQKTFLRQTWQEHDAVKA